MVQEFILAVEPTLITHYFRRLQAVSCSFCAILYNLSLNMSSLEFIMLSSFITMLSVTAQRLPLTPSLSPTG